MIRETGGYALYDTHNTDADPVSVSETLDEAKESGEDYVSELAAVDVEIVEKPRLHWNRQKIFQSRR